MSIVAQRRISSKAATDERDSSFHRNDLGNGRDLLHHRVNNDINSIVRQMATSKVASLHVENPEHRGGSREGPEVGQKENAQCHV